jgi:hypothetical protein
VSLPGVAHARDSAQVLYASELEIRLGEGLVLASNQPLTLSVREFELLVAMAAGSEPWPFARSCTARSGELRCGRAIAPWTCT